MNTLSASASAMVWLAVGIVGIVALAMMFQDMLIARRRSRKPQPRWRMKCSSISRLDGTVFYEVQKRGNFAWTTYGDTLTKKEAEAALKELESGGEK